MKTPTVVIVIGICMLLFGGCGVMSSVQSLAVPAMTEFQDGLFEGLEEVLTDSFAVADSLPDSTSIANEIPQGFKKMGESYKNMFTISAESKLWIVRFGYIGIIINMLYLICGIFVLTTQHFAVKLSYIVVGLSLFFAITETFVLSAYGKGSIFGMAFGMSNVFGVVLDIIVLVVLITMPKGVFRKQEIQFEQRDY